MSHAKNKIQKKMKYYDKANYDEIKAILNIINWYESLNLVDIDDMWNKFKDTITQEVEKHVPKKSVPINLVKRVPLSKDQLTLIKQKHKLWEKFCETKSQEDHRKACKVRNKVKNMMNKAKNTMN